VQANTETPEAPPEDPASLDQGEQPSSDDELDAEWQGLRDQCLAEARTVRDDVDSFRLVNRRTDEEGNRFVYFQLQPNQLSEGEPMVASSDDHFACRISPDGEVLLLPEG